MATELVVLWSNVSTSSASPIQVMNGCECPQQTPGQSTVSRGIPVIYERENRDIFSLKM